MVDRADAGPGARAAPQQLEQDRQRIGVPERHHARLDVGVQPPGRPDPTGGQERLDVRQPLLGQPWRLGGHHDEDPLPGQPEELGGLPERVPVGNAAGEQRLHQGGAFPRSGEQQLRRGLPVGDRELLGVLADEPPHPAGRVHDHLRRRLCAPSLVDDGFPQLGEADPVGVKDVRQRGALLGPAATGGARRGQVGRPVGGELADHRLEVAGDRAPEVVDADDVAVAVELDLRQDALHDPVDQLGKPRPDRPRDLGDLGREDDTWATCAVPGHGTSPRRDGPERRHRDGTMVAVGPGG
jgi:hypothetical protein